jgi:hypothetical protein
MIQDGRGRPAMGLLDRFRSRPAQSAGVRGVELIGGSRVDAVGEASYQHALERLVGGKCEDGWDEVVQARLVREPTNSHDPNAVKVEVDGIQVGYLGRADAIAYKAALLQVEKAKAVAVCEAHIVGGWSRGRGDEGFFGIWLDLAGPKDCLPFD